MDDYDEIESRRFLEFLARMQEDHQRRQLAYLETALSSSLDPTPVPMPDTCHPAFASRADSVRRLLFEDRFKTTPIKRPAVFILEVRRQSAYGGEQTHPTEAISTSKILLDRKRCYGGAPFIGDPREVRAAYFWNAWVDKLGRWISEDATLIYGPQRR